MTERWLRKFAKRSAPYTGPFNDWVWLSSDDAIDHGLRHNVPRAVLLALTGTNVCQRVHYAFCSFINFNLAWTSLLLALRKSR